MHLDAFPVPWAECPREGNDRETTPQHTGGQHCGLSHADDGDVEELPSAEQPGIPEGRDNRRINLVMGLGKHLEGHSPPDLRLRPRGNVGHATRGSHGHKLGSGRRGLSTGHQ